MSSYQESAPLVNALKGLLSIIEERPLGTLERETSYIIYNFDINQTILKPDHEQQLNHLINFLDAHPEAQIVSIIGRASQTGSEPNNEGLAFGRAEMVRDYLITNGISVNRIGPTIASGSTLPIVNAIGSELSINRSVEIIYDWKIELVQPPTIASSRMTSLWHIDLSVTIGAGAAFYAGQVQFGRLTKRTSGESRSVEAFLQGPELGKSLGPVLAVSVGIPGVYEEGDFETPSPVDFDYFDGQPIALYPIGGSLVVGGSATKLVFPRGGVDDPSTRFANVDIGFTFGIGAAALYGILNVHDR